MVKNVKGGSGHKSQARKFVAPKAISKTRLAIEEGEQYAYVTNKSGGENLIVICQDNISRRCVIRGKFRSSRGKRDNFISKGTWVLVGLRDWSGTNSDVCDLLEVYNDSDKSRLTTVAGVNWGKFISHDMECSNSTAKSGSGYEDDAFEFSNTATDAAEDEFAELIATSKATITLRSIDEEGGSGVVEDEEIDLDDI
jgi:translation initiation factor IF-1